MRGKSGLQQRLSRAAQAKCRGGKGLKRRARLWGGSGVHWEWEVSAAGRRTGEGKCRRAWDCGDSGSGLQVMAPACGCGEAGEMGAGGRGAGGALFNGAWTAKRSPDSRRATGAKISLL